ncbi:Dehydrogenase citC [Cladobotryum mycophilum]|uniref:Dehydrogenase citC n=1 Tax=Cladobotryum mycophilum TaxID=491253 RepID=A0ABR0SIZ6_9HYPO
MASSFSPDYIVVGGGTSGLVLANRLSEDPKVYVLVLEAGDDLSGDPCIEIPGFWTTLMGSGADWQYQTITQPGLGNRSVKETQGKALGGSSAIGAQSFVMPSQADIDAWAKLGNVGWDWANLAPYYKKSHIFLPPSDSPTLDHLGINWIDENCHGTSGPVKVSFPGTVENPLCKTWIDAFRGLDKLTTGDPFSGNSTGGYSSTATVDPDTKTRSYAQSAYGTSALTRPNVQVLTGAKAYKVLFEEIADGVMATGVQASVKGREEMFIATKEVILAAGVFNTPKLLELSGIGQKELLERHEVPVIVDLPGVGENLHNQLMTGVSFEVADGVVTSDPLLRKEPEALALAQKLYDDHKTGPFTFGGIQSIAFMPISGSVQKEILDKYSPGSEDTERYNVIRSIIESPEESSASWYLWLAQANLHESGKSFVGTHPLPENFISLGCMQCYPFSRGATHISSDDVNAMPIIDPRYFSHPADLEIMARHVQSLEMLRQTEGLASFLKPDGKRNHPDAFKIADLEAAKKYTIDTATTSYHSCGTAAMLPRHKGGVVDSKLVVYGTTNLRIVDASVIPITPRGYLMSSVYAIAGKAADIIKGL